VRNKTPFSQRDADIVSNTIELVAGTETPGGLMRWLIHSVRDYLDRAERERPTSEQMIGSLRYCIDSYEQELLKRRGQNYQPGGPNLETRSSS
jgi:hypothetical protein